MGVPDPNILSGWLDLWKKLSPWLKVILPVVVITIVGVYFYLQFYGPVPKLNDQITGLKSNLAEAESEKSSLRDQITGLEVKLAEAESEKSSLRDRKDELHRENLHLKTITVPVQEMLEQRYPEMEITDAIARLAEDVKTVHSLATRYIYKALAAQKKKELIDKLQALLGRFTSFTHTATICYDQGSSSRASVALDLKKYLEEAGFEVKLMFGMFPPKEIPVNISITLHPDDTEFVGQFVAAVNPLYIDERFHGTTQEKISRGCFEIIIQGDPLFTELGVVKFQ